MAPLSCMALIMIIQGFHLNIYHPTYRSLGRTSVGAGVLKGDSSLVINTDKTILLAAYTVDNFAGLIGLQYLALCTKLRESAWIFDRNLTNRASSVFRGRSSRRVALPYLKRFSSMSA